MRIVRIGDGANEQPPADVIGAKAANLARMAALGLPVPPAFVLPISLCAAIVAGDPDARRTLADRLAEGIAFLEQATGRLFGDHRRPLLVSVRSGAARSMPGMLDTVLDVGCTLTAVRGLIRATGNPRFAWDCRCRYLESHGTVVRGMAQAGFDRLATALAATEGVDDPAALDGEALERLAARHLRLIEEEVGPPPDTPMEQLSAAAQAVYRSWTSERARTYRHLQHLDDLAGTAVTVQAMIFGNRGLTSGAGVAFSRDPSTGAAAPVIDVLFDSQGEDVVSGHRTPDGEDALLRATPTAAAGLRDTLDRLEREFGDVQDVEFTVEDGALWILQTRAAKRTPQAALRFAIDLVREGRITPAQALERLDGLTPDALTERRLADPPPAMGRGIPASAGVAAGRAAFDSAAATRLAADDPVILLRPDTTTADVAGFAAAAGIVTAVGGRTAHAALVARQMGKPCIVGCAGLEIDLDSHRARLDGTPITEGDWLSIDGAAGTIHPGRAEIITARPDADLAEVARWRRETRSS